MATPYSKGVVKRKNIHAGKWELKGGKGHLLLEPLSELLSELLLELPHKCDITLLS